MIDLNKKEISLVYKHLKSFLKNFEADKLEYNFWNNTYSLDDLSNIKEKLKTILEKNA